MNDWITLKGRGYHKINNWNFTFHELWDLPSLPGNEPSNGLPVKISRDEGCANKSFVSFMVNHDAWICLYSFLTRIHSVSSSWNITMGCGKEAVKVIAACWGSLEQPQLWISEKEQPSLGNLPALCWQPAWVWTNLGLSLSAPLLAHFVLFCWIWHRRSYFKWKPFMKAIQDILFQRVKPVSRYRVSLSWSVSPAI